MREVLDRVEARGVEKGRIEGIEKGRREGIEKGRLEGIREGKLEGAVTTLASLVKDGILSIEDAAKRANMSVEVFKKYIYWKRYLLMLKWVSIKLVVVVRHRRRMYMKHVVTLNEKTLKESLKRGGCGECQTSCQSACKTSCTVGNQGCENPNR